MFIKKVYDKCAEFLNNPQKVFYSALAIGGICTVFMTLFLNNIYADTANVYAYFAREIGKGNWSDGIVARVPMLNIVLGGLLAMTGMEAVSALTLVAGIFYCAACFPLRRFMERYVTPIQAAWGCVLYITAPKIIRFGCSPLLESARIFFLISAILFFFETMERPSWKKGILFGISCGVLMVARGEGFPIALALLAGFLPWTLIFCRNGKFKKQAVSWALGIVFAALVSAPFCAMNYCKAGYFVPDVRSAEISRSILGMDSSALSDNKTEKAVTEKTPAMLAVEKLQAEENARAKESKVVIFISDLLRGGYELYWLLAVLGGVVFIRQKKMSWDHLLICGVASMHFVMYLMIVSSYRYYLFTIPLFMMFTVTGAAAVRRKAVEYLPAKLLPIAVLLCGVVLVFHIANGVERAFSKRGREQQKVGAYLEEYGKKHFPGRRLRILERDVVEVVYWSKAFNVNGYDQAPVDIATYSDFDLAVCGPRTRGVFDAREDMELIPDTPYQKRVLIYRFKKKPADK